MLPGGLGWACRSAPPSLRVLVCGGPAEVSLAGRDKGGRDGVGEDVGLEPVLGPHRENLDLSPGVSTGASGLDPCASSRPLPPPTPCISICPRWTSRPSSSCSPGTGLFGDRVCTDVITVKLWDELILHWSGPQPDDCVLLRGEFGHRHTWGGGPQMARQRLERGTCTLRVASSCLPLGESRGTDSVSELQVEPPWDA